MMHPEIDREEVVERYVLGQLSPEQRQAFEEHFFACDECFQKVQDVERLRAGIRGAGTRGLLNDAPALKADPATWFRWAFAGTACATFALALLTVWILGSQIPSLRLELRRAAAQLERERQARTELERKIASAELPEPNVPLIMLQASRATESPSSITLSGGATRLLVWIEIGPTRFHSFRMEVFAADNRPVLSLDHLERSAYGALAVSLPVEQLPGGVLRIILSGQSPLPVSVVGEYRLKIDKQ